jgi:hypothetical protein
MGTARRVVPFAMSTELSHAMRRSPDPLILLRYLDIAIIVLAAPFVVLTGLPVLGYAVGGGVWTAQRLISARLEAVLRAQSDIRRSVGIGLALSLARAWVVGLSILAVGLIGARADGVAAAVLALVAFTVYFVISLIIRPLERNAPRS